MIRSHDLVTLSSSSPSVSSMLTLSTESSDRLRSLNSSSDRIGFSTEPFTMYSDICCLNIVWGREGGREGGRGRGRGREGKREGECVLHQVLLVFLCELPLLVLLVFLKLEFSLLVHVTLTFEPNDTLKR